MSFVKGAGTMRALIIATVLGLAMTGCSKPDAPADLEQVEGNLDSAGIAGAGPITVDGGTVAGTFSTVDTDGAEAIWTMNEDGTFTLAANGLDPVTGTYINITSENGAVLCAKPDDADAGDLCWDLSRPGEDGSWTATSDDGSVLTMTRVQG